MCGGHDALRIPMAGVSMVAVADDLQVALGEDASATRKILNTPPHHTVAGFCAFTFSRQASTQPAKFLRVHGCSDGEFWQRQYKLPHTVCVQKRACNDVIEHQLLMASFVC